MSRVDEALRLAQRAALRAPRDTAVTDELRTHDVDPSILDRFGAERPVKSLEHFQPAPAQPMPVPMQQIGPAPRVSPPLRSVRYNPALEGKLVISKMVPVAMEQYRRLAAVLHDLRLENGPKTMSTLSCVIRFW